MNQTKLSVIVPTHRRANAVYRLAKSLLQQNFSHGKFEIIIVSNLEDKDLESQLSSLDSQSLKYFFSGHIGVNIARNLGRQKAQADILVYLDDDCEPVDENYLSQVYEYHKRYPKTAALGGPYILPKRASWVAQAYHFIADQWLRKGVYNPPQAAHLFGGNVSYKVKDFDAMNGFDESIIFGGAETDLHIRMLQAGYKLLFFDDIPVVHHLELDFFDFIRKAQMQGRAYEKRSQQDILIPKEIQEQIKKRSASLPKKHSLFHQAVFPAYDYFFNKGRSVKK